MNWMSFDESLPVIFMALMGLSMLIYVVSDGSGRPARVHERAPSFANLQALARTIEGGLIADAIACIATLDPIMGEVDR